MIASAPGSKATKVDACPDQGQGPRPLGGADHGDHRLSSVLRNFAYWSSEYGWSSDEEVELRPLGTRELGGRAPVRVDAEAFALERLDDDAGSDPLRCHHVRDKDRSRLVGTSDVRLPGRCLMRM